MNNRERSWEELAFPDASSILIFSPDVEFQLPLALDYLAVCGSGLSRDLYSRTCVVVVLGGRFWMLALVCASCFGSPSVFAIVFT